MIARIATWVWLTVVFLAVTESLSVGSIVGGAVLSAVLMVLIRPQAGPGGPVRVRPLALARYVLFFAYKLVQANLHVAWAVIAPSRAGLRRGIIEVPVEPASRTVLSLLSMSVSLTPGTSIVDTKNDPPVLYIHVLQVGSVEHVRAQVLTMERGLVRALGPQSSIANIDRRLAELTGLSRPRTDDGGGRP